MLLWWCGDKNQTRMHSSGMPTARVFTVSQHALHRGGLSARGVSAQGGCLPIYGGGSGQGGLARGMSGQGDVCPWGCLTRGGVPACNGPDPPIGDRHLWKHNLRKLRLRAVINCLLHWSFGNFTSQHVKRESSLRRVINNLNWLANRTVCTNARESHVDGRTVLVVPHWPK